MPNANAHYEVECPICTELRLVRSDVIKRVVRQLKPLICKGCHNRIRFAERDHPAKGTGVKHDPDLLRTRTSFYKAKQRCAMGAAHHPCYANVEFRLDSLQHLIECIGIRPEGMTLDRIDPFGHYEPGNIRWATMQQQVDNRLPRNYWNTRSSGKA